MCRPLLCLSWGITCALKRHLQADQASEAGVPGDTSAILATCLCQVSKLLRYRIMALLQAAGSEAFAGFAQHATSWIGAAVSSLRLLPLLDATAGVMRQRQQAAWVLAAVTAAISECMHLAVGISVSFSLWAERLEGHPQAAQQLLHDTPTVLNALWDLHTAGCRAVQRDAAKELTPLINTTLLVARQLLAITGDPQHCR